MTEMTEIERWPVHEFIGAFTMAELAGWFYTIANLQVQSRAQYIYIKCKMKMAQSGLNIVWAHAGLALLH